MKMTTEEMIKYPERVTQEMWVERLTELSQINHEARVEELLGEIESVGKTAKKLSKKVEKILKSCGGEDGLL